MPSVACIYSIRFLGSDKVYIGRTGSAAKRWYQHRHQLANGTHCNAKMQDAYKQFGDPVFAVVCEAGPGECLKSLETQLISEYDSFRFGYNMTKDGEGGGPPLSEASRKRISDAVKRYWAENREELQAIHRTPELRRKLSEQRLAAWKNPEYRAAMTAASQSSSAKETRALAMNRLRQDPEYQRKTLAGLKHPETLEKKSKSMKAFWADLERSAKTREVFSSADSREKKKTEMHRRWADPEYGQRIKDTQQKNGSLAMRSLTMTRKWSEDDYRSKMALRELHTPEANGKRATTMRDRWRTDLTYRDKAMAGLVAANAAAAAKKKEEAARRFGLPLDEYVKLTTVQRNKLRKQLKGTTV